MKKTLTILCLSDLHYLPDSSGAEALKKIELVTSNMEYALMPDYIVVAGDIIKYSSGQEERSAGYQSVKKLLDGLVESYKIDKNKIIIVPGNHDKVCKSDVEKEQASIKSLQDFCLNTNSDKTYKYEENFGQQFKTFADFYSPYIIGNYFSPIEDDTSTNYLRNTIGIKFFDEDKICFVTINTEITYTQKNTKEPDVLRLVPQLVNRIIEKLANSKYANYRVVTVMHRNPNEFSFAEINEWSSLDYIYNWSDIILTGHNHPDRCQMPHFMANHAQLFKLGAASLNSRDFKEPSSYNALILKVDSSENKLEYYYLKHDLGEKNGVWKIESYNEVILKDSRYILDKPDNLVNPLDVPYVYANDTSQENLEQAVRRCFRFDTYDALFVRYVPCGSVDYLSRICDKIRNKIQALQQEYTSSNLFVVFIYNRYSPEHSLLKQIMKSDMGIKNYIVQMKIIVIEAILKTPMLPYKKLEHES